MQAGAVIAGAGDEGEGSDGGVFTEADEVGAVLQRGVHGGFAGWGEGYGVGLRVSGGGRGGGRDGQQGDEEGEAREGALGGGVAGPFVELNAKWGFVGCTGWWVGVRSRLRAGPLALAWGPSPNGLSLNEGGEKKERRGVSRVCHRGVVVPSWFAG